MNHCDPEAVVHIDQPRGRECDGLGTRRSKCASENGGSSLVGPGATLSLGSEPKQEFGVGSWIRPEEVGL